jgi:hypothetical protein
MGHPVILLTLTKRERNITVSGQGTGALMECTNTDSRADQGLGTFCCANIGENKTFVT